MRDRIQIDHAERMFISHDRDKGHDLTDIGFEFCLLKFERLPLFYSLDGDNHIFQSLLFANRHFAKDPIP